MLSRTYASNTICACQKKRIPHSSQNIITIQYVNKVVLIKWMYAPKEISLLHGELIEAIVSSPLGGSDGEDDMIAYQ
jgi:hypothetical protein